MEGLLPETGASAYEEAVLGGGTEDLLDLLWGGAERARLGRQVEAILEALEPMPPAQACALLVRNLVERLLLFDHGLAADLDDEEFPAALRRQLRSRADLGGVDLLRLVVDTGLATAPTEPLLRSVGALLEGREGEPPAWEQLLVVPTGARRLSLEEIPAGLKVDPQVLSSIFAPARHPSVAERIENAWTEFLHRASEAWRDAWGSLGLEPAEVLGSVEGEPRLGERWNLRVRPEESPARLRPVIVRRVEGRHDVLFPLAEEDWVTLDAFPPGDGEGEMLIPLVLKAPTGSHRYTVILVPDGQPVDFSLGPELRWRPVLEEAVHGRLPTSSGELVVTE